MNPAVLNYLQSQQENPESGPAQPAAPPYNPFDLGIRRAIDSARESLGMTEKQQDKAMRRSLMAFSNTMAQEPVQKGFLNNFGAIARSMNPAINAYDATEEQSLAENNNLANQILGYSAAEEAKMARMEEQQWRRQHAENQLAEQQRYHDMMDRFRNPSRGRLEEGGVSEAEVPSIGSEFLPIETKNEVAAYAKDKRALGSVLKEVTDLTDSYNKFRKDYEGNIIDPMSAIAGVANPAKDFLGRFGYMNALRQESADRKTLGSKLNKFVVTSERALKGGGVMGPTLIKMFKEQGIYPDLDHDTPEVFESKLHMLSEEIENSYKAANLSLNYGVRIDPSQVKDIEDRINRKEAPVQENTNEIITMRGPNGELYQIPAIEAQEAINEGFVPYTME